MKYILYKYVMYNAFHFPLMSRGTKELEFRHIPRPGLTCHRSEQLGCNFIDRMPPPENKCTPPLIETAGTFKA